MSSFSVDKIRNVCRCSHSSRVFWVNLKKWEERYYEQNCHGQGPMESFSLLLLCRVADYPIKILISQSREKGKLCSLHLPNVSASCLWDVLEPQDIPTWLKGWDVDLRWSMLWFQWAGHWILLGGWLNWTPVMCLIPWESDIYVLAFCFSVFLVSK